MTEWQWRDHLLSELLFFPFIFVCFSIFVFVFVIVFLNDRVAMMRPPGEPIIERRPFPLLILVLYCVVLCCKQKRFVHFFSINLLPKKLPSQMTRWVMTQRVIWFGHFLLLEMKEQSIKEIDTSRASNCNNDPGSTQFILLLCDKKRHITRICVAWQSLIEVGAWRACTSSFD